MSCYFQNIPRITTAVWNVIIIISGETEPHLMGFCVLENPRITDCCRIKHFLWEDIQDGAWVINSSGDTNWSRTLLERKFYVSKNKFFHNRLSQKVKTPFTWGNDLGITCVSANEFANIIMIDKILYFTNWMDSFPKSTWHI